MPFSFTSDQCWTRASGSKNREEWNHGQVPQIPATDEIKMKADEVLSTVPKTAQEYFDKMTGAVAKTKVVSNLVSDIKENPKKVGCEAGIAGAVGAAVFAGLRLYDSYVADKPSASCDEDLPESENL